MNRIMTYKYNYDNNYDFRLFNSHCIIICKVFIFFTQSLHLLAEIVDLLYSY